MASRFLDVTRPGVCINCRVAISVGERAYWDAIKKTLECRLCCPEALDIDEAGGSAQREHDRRKANREKRIRAKHRKLGGVLIALTDDPTSTKVWQRGAGGERLLATRLDPLRDEGMVVLHDRRIPNSRANIDHIVVAPSGVWVIDAKRYSGEVTQRDVGGIFRTDLRLYVGSRDQSKLVAGMQKQVDAVRSVVGDAADVRPALAFVEAQWKLFKKPLRFGELIVVWPAKLVELIRAPGPLSLRAIEDVGSRLVAGLNRA